MNPMLRRILQALCAVAAAALLSACGGASSTVDAFKPTRVIAFGDGFSYVDANGYGLSTVRTPETDNTVAGRIAARVGIVVKPNRSNPLPATGGFSYAAVEARAATGTDSVDSQITTFLTDVGGVVAKQDLIIITVGNWDIYDAVMTGASVDTATTNLVTSIGRLVAAGAEHVVVMPAINMARTPWALSGLTTPSLTNFKSLADIQKLSITTASLPSLTSFNFLLLQKLNAAYRQDKKPVYLLDRSGDFNGFAGKFDTDGATRIVNVSGMALTADTGLYQPVCPTPTLIVGCTIADLNGSTNYLSYVFADNINLTPLANRYLADRIVALLLNYGWLP
jgi:phospholipase/lecithinase/hemolysin